MLLTHLNVIKWYEKETKLISKVYYKLYAVTQIMSVFFVYWNSDTRLNEVCTWWEEGFTPVHVTPNESKVIEKKNSSNLCCLPAQFCHVQ
jgi:hypothetical protein